MKLDKICRTCLFEKANLKSLFDACVPSMIMSFASVQIIQGDDLPQHICLQCLRDVNKAFTFKQTCEKSDATLRNYINSINFNSEISQLCDISSQMTNGNSIMPIDNIISNCNSDNLMNSCNIIANNNLMSSNNMDIMSNTNTLGSSMGTLANAINTSLDALDNDALNDNNLIDIENNVMNSINAVRNNLFNSNEVLQQSSFFQDIFNDPANQSLVDNFTNNQANTGYSSSAASGNTFSSQITGKLSLACFKTLEVTRIVVSDLAETMQSLQTIAEQCLPESWDNDNQICPINAEDTSSGFPLIEHIYKCQFCGETFKDGWSLDEHTKSQACQEKYFSTNITNELTKSMLLEYSFDTNSKDNFMFENIEPASQNLLCDICDRTFTDQKYLKKHLKDIHFIDTTCVQDEKKHTCTMCGKRYKSNKILLIHMRTHTGERPLKCEICSRTFALPSSLQKHKKIHKERQYECHICGKKFNQQSNLNTHLLVHSGAKPHICTTCGKRFATNTNLEIHKRQHTGVKPFVCTFCDKAFISSTQLKKHMMVHTGEKPYSCWICGQSFRRKETRDTHARYHTGERPYSCKICDKKFIAASHLRDHKKIHNTDRKFDCMICTKKFPSLKGVKSHILSHAGQKPFTCSFCGKSYTLRKAFKVHLKSCHS